MTTIAQLKREMQRLASPAKAQSSQWFFQTAKGQYGHGDRFLGLTVPEQRLLAKKYRDAPLGDVLTLLKSKIHEHRLTALLILVDQFKRGDEQKQSAIAKAYVANKRHVNNWDLVDSSAPYILGAYLLDRPKGLLDALARSTVLWDRRIAILSTQHFIRHGRFTPTMRLAKKLLRDDQDLMHKAVGWMLREVGDRDQKLLRTFLNQHAAMMPRTMLRYAIEKFSATERQRYLAKA